MTNAAPKAAPNPLSIRNLSLGFRKPLFENADLEVPKNEFITVMGENGAGKTSLIDCLMGQIEPKSGEILFWGERNQGRSRQSIQNRVGWVISQKESYAPWLRVSDVLRAASALYPKWNHALVADLASRFKLDLSKKMGHLSMGEGSKVRLLKALAFEPELLILDELTANLSPESKKVIIQTLLSRFAMGSMSVLYICHSDEEALRLSDQIYVLSASGLAYKTESSQPEVTT